MRRFARSTPSRSISSSPSRSPAVSHSVKRTPESSMLSSTASRVVPARAETMARSDPSSALSTELLPVFGLPASTTVTPPAIFLPVP